MFSPPKIRSALSKVSRRTITASLKARRRYQHHDARKSIPIGQKSYVASGAIVLLLGCLFAVNQAVSDGDDTFPNHGSRGITNMVYDLVKSSNRSDHATSGPNSKEETPSVRTYAVVPADNDINIEEKSATVKDFNVEENSGTKEESNLEEEVIAEEQAGTVDSQKDEVVKKVELFNKGEPICFVIGTGVDASHDEFEEGQVLQLSDPSDESTPVLESSTFRIPKDASEQDQRCWAHETRVASVIAGKRCGVSPGTKLVDVRVACTDECAYRDEDLERRFKQIKTYLEANPDMCAIINLSMGSSSQTNVGTKKGCVGREEWRYPKTIMRDPVVDGIIADIYYMGTLVIASSGNNCYPAFTTWPASNPYVLSVGALDRDGKMDEVSNFGATLLARGVDVRVAGQQPSEYDFASGTSYAAPYVTGMACCLLEQAEDLPGLRTPAVRPGGLKSLLLDRFAVRQQGLTQPERLRRRSDGEEPEEDEGKESDETGDGQGNADGDADEDLNPLNPGIDEGAKLEFDNVQEEQNDAIEGATEKADAKAEADDDQA